MLCLSYFFQCLLLLGKRFPLNNLNSIEFQDLNFVCDDIISFRLRVYSEGIFTFNIKRVAISFSLLEGITPKLAKTIKKIRMESIRKREPLQPEWIWSLLSLLNSVYLRLMSVVSFHGNLSNININGLQEQTDKHIYIYINKHICSIFIFPMNHSPKTKGGRFFHQKTHGKMVQS